MKVIKSIIKKYHVTIIMIIKSMYQNIKKNRYSNLSKKEKDEKAIYAKNWYNNLTEENIDRAYAKNSYHSMHDNKMLELKAYQKEYQRKYRKMKQAQGNLAKNAVLTP